MDNPLKKILSLGTSFLSKKPGGTAVGIDIGTSSIKVVQVKKKGGKAVLETYGSVALGPYADTDIGQATNLPKEKTAEALASILREAGVTTNIASVSIQSASSLIFVLDLPPGIAEGQLGEIVPNEARKYIPVPITEVSLDWWVIPKREDLMPDDADIPLRAAPAARTEVLVVAIHNDSIGRYQDIVRSNSLDTDYFEIEAFSSIRALLSHELAPVLVVDFGASKTKLSLVEYGVVKSFHIINRGSADLTLSIAKSLGVPFSKAEEIKREFGMQGGVTDQDVAEIVSSSLEFIFNEANSMVLNFEKKYNKAVSKVILSGGGALLKGFLEKAEENFRVSVAMGDPFSKVEAPAFLSDVLRSIGPEFSVAVGLALKRLEA